LQIVRAVAVGVATIVIIRRLDLLTSRSPTLM
jgi:hypothetical protein